MVTFEFGAAKMREAPVCRSQQQVFNCWWEMDSSRVAGKKVPTKLTAGVRLLAALQGVATGGWEVARAMPSRVPEYPYIVTSV